MVMEQTGIAIDGHSIQAATRFQAPAGQRQTSSATEGVAGEAEAQQPQTKC